MINIAILTGIIVLLLGIIVFKEIIHLNEKNKLIEKIMALTNERAYMNYSNVDIAKTHAKKPQVKDRERMKFPA